MIEGTKTALRRASLSKPNRPVRRRAYVLILVLGMGLVALSTGIAYMESQSTVMPEAVNRMAASRAKYLSESGVELAIHYLQYPPTGTAYGGYWPGDNGLTIDSSGDFFNVRTQRDSTVSHQYVIKSSGVARYFGGDIKGVHTVKATVLVSPDPYWRVQHAILGDNDLQLESTVILDGPFHSNRKIEFDGICTDAVSAGETIAWTSKSTPASLTENADALDPPPANTSLYVTYEINGETCNALVYPNNVITTTNAAIINSFLSAQTDNPGKIVYLTSGTVEIAGGVNINGCLVINGNLDFKAGGTTRIVSISKFPAIVADGNVELKDDFTNVYIEGPVICKKMDLHNKVKSEAYIRGALIAHDSPGIKDAKDATSVTIQWMAEHAHFFDLSKTGERKPATLLSWEENVE